MTTLTSSSEGSEPTASAVGRGLFSTFVSKPRRTQTSTLWHTRTDMSDLIDQIEPYDDYIAVKPLGAETVTTSGLIIAGVEDRGHPLRGTVLRLGKGAVGKDGARIPIEAQVGDEIYFSRGTEVELAQGLTLVKEGKILVTVRDGEIIPYWDKVVVELTSDSGENASGIYIASDQSATFDKGTVAAVGSGMTDRGVKAQMELEPGMTVAFNQFEGVELDLGMGDMRRLYVTREKHVYGILSEDKTSS